MSSGKSYGALRTEGANTNEPRLLNLTTYAPARSRIVPSADWQVIGFSLNTAFTKGGSLLAELTDASGNVIRSATISQPAANYQSQQIMAGEIAGVMKWYHQAFSSPVTLSAGQTYYLRYTPQGSASVAFANIRDFRDYPGYKNLDDTHSFTAQHYYNGRWIDFYHFGHSVDANVGAWRDVLHLAQPVAN